MFIHKLSISMFAPIVLTAAVCTAGAGAQTGSALVPAAAAAAPATESVAPLKLAFDAVSKMPSRPHIKTRSRLQADLVEAALVSGHLDQASAWAQRIENWRKGLALAHIAVHHARGGNQKLALEAIARAEACEQTLTSEEEQGWRRDRVRVRIAEAYALIGHPAKAAQIQAAATPSECGRLAAMAVRAAKDADVEEQLSTLEAIARTGDLEQVRFSVLAMAELYGRALEDLGRSSRDDAALAPGAIEGRIKAAWRELPIEPRIDILERLIQLDVEAGEAGAEHASAHAQEIASLVMDHRWNPEQAIGLRARVAGLYVSVGNVAAGRKLANDALARFETSRKDIVNVYRGEALRPLAEAFVALGDPTTATKIYERALEEALDNPNSRPRATDLALTAVSVTSHGAGYEVPATLFRAFERASQAIGSPW